MMRTIQTISGIGLPSYTLRWSKPNENIITQLTPLVEDDISEKDANANGEVAL